MLEATGLVPDVIVVEGDTPPYTVTEQVPAAGSDAELGDTIVLKAVGSDGETTTTTEGTETTEAGSTTTAAGGTSTTAGPTTTAGATTSTAAAAACQSHPYYDEMNDPNCTKADYRTPVNSTTSPRVWQCMSQGHGVYYNQDQPGNLGCEQNRNRPNLYYKSNPPAVPYPDYDPTIGSVDTFLECAWKDAQLILSEYEHLSQGNNTIQDQWEWIVTTSNKVCA